ncbi:MAG TPA: hypothetical protein P5186_18065 [Candidatus Paceibacterota bacterium]|nr:hypothetical protein [Verrucomicrobiota bacterium]HRY49960.1 hypothetical protein [Candidatus Paceibacterota bacterium]HRZ99617.1 hypothetical protein [Candidatus Paceibacterota bacterium]
MELTPVGSPAPFGAGDSAGDWGDQGTNSVLSLSVVAAGMPVQAQVRIWDSSVMANFDQALISR